jgi:hypothetical protein
LSFAWTAPKCLSTFISSIAIFDSDINFLN